MEVRGMEVRGKVSRPERLLLADTTGRRNGEEVHRTMVHQQLAIAEGTMQDMCRIQAPNLFPARGALRGPATELLGVGFTLLAPEPVWGQAHGAVVMFKV